MARSQTERPFRLKSTLGDDVLLLESFEGRERLSTPFRFILRVIAANANIDMKGQLTQALVMSIKLEHAERHIHGYISRMKLLNVGDDGWAAYEIEMVPGIWFLHLFSDCRIFQNKSVPDILEAVFKARDFTEYRNDLSGTYQPREYCVQYRESDFNFVSRLMEEEGIFYYFQQTKDKCTMVLVDKKESLTPCPHQAEAKFTPSEGGRLDEDTVSSVEEELQVCVGTATLTDYDFEKPSSDLTASLSGEPVGEYYDYPGKYKTKDDGDRYARVRLEEKEARLTTVRGESNVLGFECGYKYTLKEHYREKTNQEYAIVALEHRGTNTSYRSNAQQSGFQYSNRFETIPASVEFRPPRLAKKPVIRGSQTAVVVGKAGEEIWTDKYGRVIVQFFWDRDGKDDENSSCWIRVSHSWAGKQWGAIFTPRTGQEVIVSFLEGDPDQPIITGRVYNGDQMPPYTLPDEGTKSTVKTMSSKGGGGFNEIRFEDKAGSEQVFHHAEKDLDVRVKNDAKSWIGNDEHRYVKGKRAEKIEGDHFLEILGNEGIKVTGDHSLSVQGNVVETFKGNHTIDVTQNIYIKGQQIVIQADTGLTLKVGSNFITIDPSGISLKGTMIQLNSAGAALSGSPGQPVSLQAPANADDAKPGAVTSPSTPARSDPHKKVTLQSIPAAGSDEPADEPERQAKSGSGGGSSQGELATFPKNVDAVAVAAILKEAAQSGVPFCEECEKAKQQQETA